MNASGLKKFIIFFLGAVLVLFIFTSLLSFPNEAFYMSLPVCWLIFQVIYHPRFLRRWFTLRTVVKGVAGYLCVLAYFGYISAVMGWRIIFREVFLSAYFLLSVGIVIHWVRLVVRLIAQRARGMVKTRKWKMVAYGATFLILWGLTILPFIVATFTIHRPKIGNQIDPLSGYGLPYQDVALRAKDGVIVHAWFVPMQGSDKGVVIGHGLGANKSNFLPLVKLWHDLDYNVLIFDFRGHGQSQGHTLTFGLREKYDIIAAVDYLSGLSEIDPQKIVGYGVSFGAAAVIHAAAEDTRIRAVVVDSSFADVDVMARKVVDSLFFVPPFLRGLIADVSLGFVNLEIGCDIRAASPMGVIRRIENRPVYIIHGVQDKLVPFEEALTLYALANAPKQHYWIDTPGHYATLADSFYAQRINNFLNDHGV